MQSLWKCVSKCACPHPSGSQVLAFKRHFSPLTNNPFVHRTESGLYAIDHSPFVNGDEVGKRQVASAVAAVCEDIGCFYISGKGVMDFDAMVAAREDARKFFRLPIPDKLQSSLPAFPIRGYTRFAEHSRSIEPNDPLESFAMGPPDTPQEEYYRTWHFLPNLWPQNPPTFGQTWSRYYKALTDCAGILFRCFSVSLGLPEDHLLKLCDKGPHSLKANYYSVVKKPLKHEPRVLEHTDATLFTLLMHMDPTPKALVAQKRDTKEWVWADPYPGGIFVNIGDFMERWTNNRFTATVHRVEWPWEGKALVSERISSAFFAVPNYETKMGCAPTCINVDPKKPSLPEITYDEYLMQHKQRIKSSGY